MNILTGAAVEWRCDPYGDAPRVYFANHSSHLDFVAIWSALPRRVRRAVRPVAGRDYWDRGLTRRLLADRVFHAVLIDRGGAVSGGSRAVAARAALHRMAGEMAERHSLIVFPEGTRSRDGRIGTFKSGLFHLSRLCPDAELIPVYLDNLNRVLPKGEFLPVPMLSRVVFGPPLGGPANEDKLAFLARAREAIFQLRGADASPN
jgi:1-acyl-sn-glycerol-3-phosphate acyltransferase